MLLLSGCSMPPPTCMRCLDAKEHSSLLAGVLWIVGSRLGDQRYLAQAVAYVHAQAVSHYQRLLRIVQAGLFPKSAFHTRVRPETSADSICGMLKVALNNTLIVLRRLLDSSSQLTTAPEL